MRDETRRRLDRQLALQKLKWVGVGLASVFFLGAGLWFTGLDATVTTRHVAGVVQAVGPIVGGTTQMIENGVQVDVKLEDGHLVHVLALKTTDPHVGDRIEVAEHIHGTGRVTYSWK